MNIGKYIYAKLSATSAITDLVGTRIYPIYLPKDAAYPAIVFMAENTPKTPLMKGQKSDHDVAKVRFHIWADASQGQDAYASLDAIDSALRTALDYVEGTAGGVNVEICHYDGSTDGRDDEMILFMRQATYTFTTKNA